MDDPKVCSGCNGFGLIEEMLCPYCGGTGHVIDYSSDTEIVKEIEEGDNV